MMGDGGGWDELFMFAVNLRKSVSLAVSQQNLLCLKSLNIFGCIYI